MSEKKTTLTSLRNQHWKTVKIETEKIINKYLNNQGHGIVFPLSTRIKIENWDGKLDWKYK